MTITVKDVVREAAQSLGVGEDVDSYLNGTTNATGEQAAALLTACFLRVENELALDYIPLLMEEEMITTTGAVEYASLSKPVSRIFCVEDEWGESMKYRLFPAYLTTKAGKVKIIYAYAPSEKTIEDESDYKTVVSKRLLTYGTAAEYSLAVGDLSAASVWDKKYKEGVQAAYKTRVCKRLRSRRWI